MVQTHWTQSRRKTRPDVIDEEFASPNSRWEASEELSTTNKRMNKFERRALARSYHRPAVDAAYTPSMDDYLKPLIPGIMAQTSP